MKTARVTPAEIKKKWFVVDANDQVLGRLATQIAYVLRGKQKANYVPHLDCGDFVVVTNAEKVRLTGRKENKKTYHWHSGYVGGIKSASVAETRAKHPDRIIEHAVRGMLPKNKLGRKVLKNLKIYAGTDHPHKAQNPQPMVARTAEMA